jgi:hypothetical protein
MSERKRNLIWIIVDSVRTFKTGIDDRDRLDFMDEFGLESVEFLKAFASAPSSILSGAAMFTGMPSAFIARHFSDWQFDPEYILSIQDVLAKNGYKNYAIHNSKEDRRVMYDLIHPLPHKYFPRGISHGEWWTNNQVNLVLENVLYMGIQEPAFFMLWYDCRRDPAVSDRVKQGMQLFKENGLYEDSIIILTSDHGYPDPSSGLTESSMRGMRHDMVVTDDNIQVPLFIKCPGYPPRKVSEMVGLIDLFPTILRLLEIDNHDPRMDYVQGYDLSPLMVGEPVPWRYERIIRVDTRLSLAPGRITALRTNSYKYVYFHDKFTESFFNLEEDPLELNDLLSGTTAQIDKNQAIKMRAIFHEMQTKLYAFHSKELLVAFDKYVARIKRRWDVMSMLFISTAPVIFLRLTTKSFREAYPGLIIDILIPKEYPLVEEVKDFFDNTIKLEEITPRFAANALSKGELANYDVVLLTTEHSSIGFDDPLAYKVARHVGKRVLLVDYNMRFYNRFLSHWVAPLRKYVRNWKFYRQEPMLVFQDIGKLIKRALRILAFKKTVDTPDMEKAKKMRDRALLAQRESASTSKD